MTTQQPDSAQLIETSGKYLKWLQSVIAIAAVLVGMAISWGVTKTKIAVMQNQIEDIIERNSKQDNEIHALQMSQIRDDTVITQMNTTLNEVRADVKKILERKLP